MHQAVEQTLQSLLSGDGYQRVRRAAATPLSLPAEFDLALAGRGLQPRGPLPNRPWPSCEWLVTHEPLQSDVLQARFVTQVRISKLVPVFCVLHWFEIPFLHASALSPTLDGESAQPYTRQQASLHDEVAASLRAAGFVEISLGDLLRYRPIGVAPIVNPSDGLVSVERLIFMDPLAALD